MTWSFLKKLKITIPPSNSTSGYLPPKIESKYSYRCLCTCIHSSIIHNSQKVETTHMSIDRWMDNKTWYIQTMEYYLALKRKELLTYASTWMDLDDIMLSERRQLKRTNIGWAKMFTRFFSVRWPY